VLPTIEDTSSGRVLLHVSIACSADEMLRGSDVDVRARAGGADLTATQSPRADDPLPVIEIRGATAIAQYTFDNPGDQGLSSVSVTMGSASATFDVAGDVA
jgi:hypothetical protein